MIFKATSMKLQVQQRITILLNTVTMLSAAETLNREFLEIRCKILELAAALDRLDRSQGAVTDDPRLIKLREALGTILEQSSDRAEQVQMIFSRAYDEDWQTKLKLAPR